MTELRPLPIPPHFDSERVREVWRVPYAERAPQAQVWARRHAIEPATSDDLKVCLLLIDVQNTFCTPDFELFVGESAVGDSARLCQFIYHNLRHITQISAALDTHSALQIFHPAFFVDEQGEHPSPGTQITVEDVKAGKWRADPAVAHSLTAGDSEALRRHLIHYVESLAQTERFALTVWPYHAMLGGIGHALVSAVEEACFFHNIARKSQTEFRIKGDVPLTENYSALRPEVTTSPGGEVIAEPNAVFVSKLLAYDRIIVAGQAKSHCVAWTVEDLLGEMQGVDPALAGRIYMLEDCTSPVIIPGVMDFTESANEAFRRFESVGIHLVRSTVPIAEWPGFVG